MATATVTDSEKAVMDVRWEAAMIELTRQFGDGTVTWTNSKRYYRIDRTLEELAALLIDDGVADYETEALRETTEAIWADIKRHLYAFAEGHHERWEQMRIDKGYVKVPA